MTPKDIVRASRFSVVLASGALLAGMLGGALVMRYVEDAPRFTPCDDVRRGVLRVQRVAPPSLDSTPIEYCPAETAAVYRREHATIDIRVTLYSAEGDEQRALDLVNVALGAIALCVAGRMRGPAHRYVETWIGPSGVCRTREASS